MRLLSAEQIGQVEDHLSRLFDRIFTAANLAPVSSVIREYVLSGGKRIRPQLCWWTWRHVSDESQPPGALLDIACGWELFHAFLLAHDDIIDSADMRRDRPSLHRRLAALDGNNREFGVNLGIVAGDLLFSGAMRLWHEIDLPADLYRRELRLFSRIAATTGFGQAIDICQSHADLDRLDERMLLREYHWKTAAYTFEGPMLSGAILARLGEDAEAAISRFALAIGQAYQLQNDLLDLEKPAHEGCDIIQGKRTVALLRGRGAMSDRRRADFDRQLSALAGANGQAVTLAESVRQELLACGAVAKTRELIDQLLSSARHSSDDPALPDNLRKAIRQLLDSLQDQYFSSRRS